MNADIANLTPGGEAPAAEHRVQVGIRLQPGDRPESPQFSNFSVVQGAQGMVFIDFGFLEPNALPSVIRLAQSGGKVPEAINGRLAARIVLGPDTAAQLVQQLEQHLRSIRTPALRPGTAEVASG